MDRILTNQPKNFPLGYLQSYIWFSIEKSHLHYRGWIPTIHNVEWSYGVNTNESDTTNKVIFTLYQDHPNEIHTIELDVAVFIENADPKYNIIVQGTYEFKGKDKNELKLELPGFDKIVDWKQGYFDDKKEKKEFKLRVFAVVKSVRLCDSVEFVDFYNFDPTIHDVEVNVMGHIMCFSKKLISLQSTYLSNMLESQNIEESDLPSSCTFDIFHDFLQVLHGVDIALDVLNIKDFLDLAHHLQVPYMTEYCKKRMVAGCRGMDTNEIVDLAEEWSFWDIVPRKLEEATCLKELKDQNWDLEKLEDETITLIARRIFELKC